MKLVEALTSEEAIQGTINMWSDMLRDLGENPSEKQRFVYKLHWLTEHGYSFVGPFRMPENECFLCERARIVWMDVIGLSGKCSCCPIEWPEKDVIDSYEPKCVGHEVDYRKAPLSDILNYLKDERNHAQWRIIE
jgi:hypothetical protein